MNHGQVASGEVPESVVDNDIDGELTEADAHANYAARWSGNWIAITSLSSHESNTQHEKPKNEIILFFVIVTLYSWPG